MNDLQTAGELRAAADYLRTHGWLQDCIGSQDGPRCIGGALWSVTNLKRAYELAGVLREAAGWQAGTFPGHQSWHPMVDWNNSTGRSADEVTDLLESVALALEVRALAANSAAASSKVADPERELVAQPIEVRNG